MKGRWYGRGKGKGVAEINKSLTVPSHSTRDGPEKGKSVAQLSFFRVQRDGREK